MSVLLTFTAQAVDYAIVFDAVTKESHSGASDITDHQVEKGSNVTDHVRSKPLTLSIEGIISNTPISGSPPQPPDGSSLTSQTGGFSGQFQDQDNVTPDGVPLPKTQTLQFGSEFNRIKDVEQALTAAKDNAALITVTTSLKLYENMVIEKMEIPREAKMGRHAVKISLDLKELRIVSTQVVDAPAPKIQKAHRGSKPPRSASDKEKEQAQKPQSALKKIAGSITNAFGGG